MHSDAVRFASLSEVEFLNVRETENGGDITNGLKYALFGLVTLQHCASS